MCLMDIPSIYLFILQGSQKKSFIDLKIIPADGLKRKNMFVFIIFINFQVSVRLHNRPIYSAIEIFNNNKNMQNRI